MTIYLDEDLVGTDKNELVFPHLLLCMGIVAQFADGLVGAHVSAVATEDAVLGGLRTQMGAFSGAPIRLYMIANFQEHFVHRKLSFTDKARTLGYTGEIFVFDTKPFVKTASQGAYARVALAGGGGLCNVYVLADEDAQPYSTVDGKAYVGAGVLKRYSSVRGWLLPADIPSVRIGDSADRPGTPLKPSAFKIARCF